MLELSTPKDDGLYIPEVGEQSRDKHYFLTRYIDAFTTAMKDKWELHYIDLFAGAGVERLKHSKELDWGSPMIAAQTCFSLLHLCEKNVRKFTALKTRIKQKLPDSQILHGDANDKVHEIVERIPGKGSLSLAFLDPYGFHLDYETLRSLSVIRADLVIFFPDHIDALRNWERNYLDNPESNLDRCLGPGANWRSLLDETPAECRAERLRDLYVNQLKKHLGYTHFEYQRISYKHHPLYVLILCARHELAAKLWRRISEKMPDGQRTFRFQ
jgi:three-Cys-motif partner protein